MSQVLAIGDIGGHAAELSRVLAEHGIQNGYIPPDLTVIQVGDLIDRGPDSPGVLEVVSQYLGPQWIQLIGNHEAQYLPNGYSFWGFRLPPPSAELLQTWWATSKMNVAAALISPDGTDTLLTHAGLTVKAWQALGEPMTAAGAAHLLNTRPDFIWDTESTGPLWTESSALYEPWMDHYNSGGFIPFSQIHGHSSPYSYDTSLWRASERIRNRATVSESLRHTQIRIGGRFFTGIDPKHKRTPALSWSPLLLDAKPL